VALDHVHRMGVILEEVIRPDLRTAAKYLHPPPTVTYPTQIGTLYHCRASN